MSHGLYDRCACGHRHPEHSLSGTCRGCLDCEPADQSADDPAGADGDDHAYRQCTCVAFSRAEDTPENKEIA